MRRRFRGRARAPLETPLQITSMADIFTILLVFLLKSFSTGAVEIAAGRDLVMPEATRPTGDELSEATKIELTEGALTVDDRPVAELTAYRMPASLGRETLALALGKEIAESHKSAPGSKLLLLADRRAPYGAVREVLTAAGRAGFTDFKLVVANPE